MRRSHFRPLARTVAAIVAAVAVAAAGALTAVAAPAQAATSKTTSASCSFGGGNADTVTVTWAVDFDISTQLVGFHPVTTSFKQTQSRGGYVTTIRQATYEWQNGTVLRAKTTQRWALPGVRAAAFTPTTAAWSWSTQTDLFVLVALVNRNGAVCVAKVPNGL